MPKRDAQSIQNEVNRLTALLDEKRETVLAIPGVTGCGVGMSGRGDLDRVAIQVFVADRAQAPAVRERVEEVFMERDVEVVFMPIPRAG